MRPCGSKERALCADARKDLKTLVELDKDGCFQVIARRRGQKDAEGRMTEASTKVDARRVPGCHHSDSAALWNSKPTGIFHLRHKGSS